MAAAPPLAPRPRPAAGRRRDRGRPRSAGHSLLACDSSRGGGGPGADGPSDPASRWTGRPPRPKGVPRYAPAADPAAGPPRPGPQRRAGPERVAAGGDAAARPRAPRRGPRGGRLPSRPPRGLGPDSHLSGHCRGHLAVFSLRPERSPQRPGARAAVM